MSKSTPQGRGTQTGGGIATSAAPAAPVRPETLLGRIALVLETIKFSHTLFALPFAAIGAVWARQGLPSMAEALLLLLAMVAARTCAMAANRVIDANLDAANPRTRNRAIPAGLLSRGSVLTLAVVAGLIFVGAAAAFMPLLDNPWPLIMAAPLLAVLIGYSYTKRFTALSHYVLGISLGLAPIGAWLALTGSISLMPLMLGAAIAFWTAGFDILYSLQDLEHDRRVHLRSIPALVGVERSLMLAHFNHLVTIALLLALYHLLSDGYIAGPRLGWLYMAGTIVFYGIIFYEHRLLKSDDLSRLKKAFFNANALGSILFAAFAIADILC